LRSGQIIRTYDSPSAYYQKPITRIYTNPYNPGGGDIYFDNDNYYVPPKNYGINTDNYNPRYRNYAPKPRVVKRYRYIKRY
jgi:hypothetical protein